MEPSWIHLLRHEHQQRTHLAKPICQTKSQASRAKVACLEIGCAPATSPEWETLKLQRCAAKGVASDGLGPAFTGGFRKPQAYQKNEMRSLHPVRPSQEEKNHQNMISVSPRSSSVLSFPCVPYSNLIPEASSPVISQSLQQSNFNWPSELPTQVLS